MEYRRLGRTGLKVTSLSLGGNIFNWSIDEATSFDVLDTYVAAGGNMVDSADVYSRWAPGHVGGESETVIGNWLKSRGGRGSVLIATKVNGPMGPLPTDKGLSRHHIMSAAEASLKRLQTDYIDLYYAHNDDLETPTDEYMRAFDDLVRQGKVRYIAASNTTAWRLVKAQWSADKSNGARFEAIQPQYNMVLRERFETDIEPAVREMEMGVLSYSSLGAGFLSGKYTRDGELPNTVRAGGVKATYMTDRGFAILDEVLRVAKEVNATPSQVAIAWVIQRPVITSAIAAATSVEQAKELAGAAELKLPAEAVAALDKVSDWRPAK